jgi:hypothetical protein
MLFNCISYDSSIQGEMLFHHQKRRF